MISMLFDIHLLRQLEHTEHEIFSNDPWTFHLVTLLVLSRALDTGAQ